MRKRRIAATTIACLVVVLSLSAIVVPVADAATGTVITSGENLNVRSGPGESYSLISKLAPGTIVSFNCYELGDSETGPYGTENIWDRLDSGGFVTDAWVYTGSNSATVPACSPTPPSPSTPTVVTSFSVGGNHQVARQNDQDTHAQTPNATCNQAEAATDAGVGYDTMQGWSDAGFTVSVQLLDHFLLGTGTKVDFDVSSPTAKQAQNNSNFKQVNSSVQNYIIGKLKAGISAISVPTSVLQPPAFSTAATDLYWAFRGTQGLSITGHGQLQNGRYVGSLLYVIADTYGFKTPNDLGPFGAAMRYLQTACGAPQYKGGAHWFPDTISVVVPFNQPV